MRKIVIMTAAVLLLYGAGGCRTCERLYRGSAAPATAAPICCPEPACDPCGGSVSPSPMIVTPGPETYAPAPMR